MPKILLLVFIAIASLSPALANAQLHHCACIHNETNNAIEFKWSVPDALVARTYTTTVNARNQALMCHNEGLFETLSDRKLDKAAVDIDVDLTAAVRNQRFDVTLAKVTTQTCAAIPQPSHFVFRPDHMNPMFLTFMGRPSGNYAAPAPYPTAPPQYSYPAASQGYPPQGYAPPPAYPVAAPGYPPQGYPSAPTYPVAQPGYPPQGYAFPPAYPTAAPGYPPQTYPSAAYTGPAPVAGAQQQPGFVPIAPSAPAGAPAPGSYTPRAPLF
jgi:hypothetical protein